MKENSILKFFGEQKLEEIDLVYLPLRVAGFFATVLWSYIHPISPSSRNVILVAIGIFALYSLPFYFFMRTRGDYKKLYLLLMVPDLIVVSVLVRFGEGMASPFLVGYYLIAALHGFYYGLNLALASATVASIMGLIVNYPELVTQPTAHWADNISKFGFLWALAISSGLFGTKVDADKKRIGNLNEVSNNQLTKLTALYEIEKAISISIDLDQILQIVLSISTKVIDGDAGSILLVDKDKQSLEFRASVGGKASLLKDLKPRYGKGVCGYVAETGNPVIIDDVASDPNYTGQIDEITGYKTNNLICVPLKTSTRIVGVIEILNKRTSRNFDSDDLEFLTSIASTASSSIEKAFLFSETEQHVDELDTILNIVNAIGLRSKLEDIFKVVLDQIKKLFPGDSGVIYLIDKKTGEMNPIQSFGYRQRGGLKHHSPTKLLECFVIADSNPLFYAKDMSGIHPCESLVDKNASSFICTPIKAGMSTFGVLHVASRDEDAFSSQHVRLAKGIGEQLAIAIQRAYLFDQVSEMAITDQLTGLLNFREFQNRLDEEFRRLERYHRPLSLLMIDIDFFKNYNDTFGHPKGDIVLKRIANILKDGARETDLIFRYGGEELSVILPETDKEQARVIAERLRQMVEESHFEGEETQPNGKLTISAGVAAAPFDAISKEGLIEKSDIALYEAKRSGRNAVKIFVPPAKKVKAQKKDFPRAPQSGVV